MFLHLNHHVVDIYELTTDWKPLKRMLGENFLKSMIILNQLGQRRLSKQTYKEKDNNGFVD